MKVLLQHIQEHSQQQPGTIVLIGAGNGSSLPALRDLNASQMVLTEAHPRLAEDLAQQIRLNAGETLWQGAIIPAPQMDRTTLHVLNNARYSSVTTPTKLLQHLPNLRETSQVEVPAQELRSLVEPLGLREENNNILVLEAPGQILALLRATPPAVLHQFQWVAVSTSPEALHENDATEAELITALANLGFDTPIEDPDALYPYNRYLIKRNDEHLRQRRADEALATRTRERDELEHKLEAQAIAHATEQAQQQAETSKLQAEITEMRKQQEAIKKTLAERDTALAAATKQREEQAKQLAAVQQQLKDVTTKHATQAKELETAKAQTASLQTDLSKKNDDAVKAQADLSELHKQQEAIKKTLAERDTALAAATKQGEEQAKQLAAVQQQLKDTNTKHATQTKELEAAKTKTASLQADLIKKNDEAVKAQTDFTELRKHQEAIKKTLAERDTALAFATKQGEEQAKQMAAAQQQLKDVKTKHATQTKELETAKTKAASLQTDLTKKNDEIRKMQTEVKKNDLHQQLLQEELIKAEAQIELIKDLLLGKLEV